MRAVRFRAALVLLTVILPSCRAVLGIDDQQLQLEPAGCFTCAVRECGAVRDACLADVDCRPLYSCLAECGVDAVSCRMACEDKFRSAAGPETPYRRLDDCRRIQCQDECYGSGGFGVTADPECACTDEICKPFLERCVRSGDPEKGERIGDCERLYGCLAGRQRPLDPEDGIACVFQDGLSGREIANTVRFCWQGAACGSCPLAKGRMYSCVGDYKWVGPMADRVKFSLTVGDNAGKPVVGAEVKACPAANCEECPAPNDTQTTDGNGVALLQVSTVGIGFRGCFKISKPGVVTSIWYLGRPIMQDESLTKVTILNADDLKNVGKIVAGGLDLTTKGHVVVATRDCLFTPAGGLELKTTAGAGSTILYMRNGNPSLEGPTDGIGQAAVMNVPPGDLTLSLHAGALEVSKTTVRIGAGLMTGVMMLPKSLENAP